jgi:PAS domain S-box-containing protein
VTVYEASFELHPDALAISLDGGIRAVNAQVESLFGYAREELLSSRITVLLPRATEPGVCRRKDGSAFAAEIFTRQLPDSSVLTAVRIVPDVTASERALIKASEGALMDANQLNQDVFKSIEVGLIVMNRDLRYMAWNPKMEEISGLRADEVLGKHPLELFPFLKEAGAERSWRRALQGETVTSPDFPFEVPAHGRKGWSSQTVGPLRDAKGEIVGVIASVSDVTNRRRTEDALRESEEKFRGLVEGSPVPMLVAADRQHILLLNQRFTDCFGYTRTEVFDMETWEQCAYPDPVYRQEVRETWKRAIAAADRAGQTTLGPVEALVTCRDGSVRFVEVHLCRHGKFSLVVFNDLTERTRAQEALRENEARLLRIMDALPVMIAALDEAGRFVSWNRECERVTGYSASEMVGNPLGFALLFPDEKSRAQALAARSRESAPMDPWQITRKDGVVRTVRWVRVSNQLPVTGWSRWGVGIDLTEQFRLEEQLRQAQKMQAVGQLAGGVAHDFNNVLTAINGYSDLLLQRMTRSDAHYEMVAAIRSAGGRAARLVKQLLLFSRKAVANPQRLDLRDLLSQTLGMLRRLIDEDIGIACVFAPDLEAIEADPGQIEQVVMNLCLNARDAMPAGGTITVSVQNLRFDEDDCAVNAGSRPGEFVRLSVVDTGCGMTPEVRAHLFEPFFTTKPAGAGTGLGLATVYGIVQQAGGFIQVASEAGKGTAVHVCLPLVKGYAERKIAAETILPARKGGETILLVEDDEQVRTIACLFLETNGYRVLQASGGPAALRLASENHGPIHLLLSDVVMPEMGGGELARQMISVRPDIKVLFMSGYNEDEMVNRGLRWSNLVQKPFTEEDLARKVREALDGRAGC